MVRYVIGYGMMAVGEAVGAVFLLDSFCLVSFHSDPDLPLRTCSVLLRRPSEARPCAHACLGWLIMA